MSAFSWMSATPSTFMVIRCNESGTTVVCRFATIQTAMPINMNSIITLLHMCTYSEYTYSSTIIMPSRSRNAVLFAKNYTLLRCRFRITECSSMSAVRGGEPSCKNGRNDASCDSRHPITIFRLSLQALQSLLVKAA